MRTNYISRRRLAYWWLACALGFGGAAQAESDPLGAARALFDRYQKLERTFDPELASLYDDEAEIWVTRIYSNGVVRQLKIPGDVYKMALRQSMAEAAEQGDFNEYSEARFTTTDQGVRIDATRFNLWRNYRSPYTALVQPDAAGQWRIVEEHFETQVPTPATE